MAVVKLKKVDMLIYSFLFDESNTYEIVLSDYCEYDNRTEFRNDIRNAVIKGGRTIVEDRIIHRENDTIWKIEIK